MTIDGLTVEPKRRFAKGFEHGSGEPAFAYEAIAEDILVLDREGAPWAYFFTTSYQVTGEARAERPVAFVFNGGPGSSAQWLHMGALGPRRLELPDAPSHPGNPPYNVIENSRTLLADADLVFVDPVGTGYSKATGEYRDEQFWGIREDARSIAALIEAWLSRHDRWSSPKYLVSESYGTLRACLVAELLAERHVALDGMALIAPVLDYRHSRPRQGDGGILSYVSFLPTYAATAAYHGRAAKNVGPGDLEEFIAETRRFALNDYARGLASHPSRLGPDDYRDLVARLSAFTGLSPQHIERSALRILPERFCKQILIERSEVVGRLDARFTASEPDPNAERSATDPSLDAVAAAFTAAMQGELKGIGVELGRPYQALVPLHEKWDWALEDKPPNAGGYVDVVPRLARLMCRYPELRLLLAVGYYDLATPFFGAENALSRDGVPHDRLHWRHYPTGHMIFLDEASRDALVEDLRTMVRRRLGSSVATGKQDQSK